MRATILGSGTSSGIPTITCRCPVCTSPDPRDQRLRASVLLEDDTHSLLIDCGPDFRLQALAHQIDRVDAVLVTHTHSDHILGLDELRIYNFRTGAAMPIHARPDALDDIRRRFWYCFHPPQEGGGVPTFDMRTIDGDFEVAGIRIQPLPAYHGILEVTGFRIGDFVYLTDANRIPEETFARMAGCRTMILNALRHEPHPTHFTVAEAIEVIRRVNPERAWFTHMCHDLGHAATNAILPPGMELAWDGLQFEFDPTAHRSDRG